MKYLAKYPRATFLLIGFTMGLFLSGMNGYWAGQTIEEYKSIVKKRETKYLEMISTSSARIATLSKLNQSLRKSVSSTKVTKPDGTITEISKSDSSSVKIVDSNIQSSTLSSTSKTESQTTSESSETSSKTTISKLRLAAGLNTELDQYIRGSYNISGPFSIGGGFTKSGTVFFDIGISL